MHLPMLLPLLGVQGKGSTAVVEQRGMRPCVCVDVAACSLDLPGWMIVYV